MDGLGFDLENIFLKAGDVWGSYQQQQTDLEIAKINAGATTQQVVEQAKSRSLLYLGIGILGAAYLLFTLRKME